MCLTGIETVPPDLLSVTGSCIKLRMTQQPPLHSVQSSKDISVSLFLTFTQYILLSYCYHTCAQRMLSLSLNFTDESTHVCGSLYAMVQSACGLQHPSSK